MDELKASEKHVVRISTPQQKDLKGSIVIQTWPILKRPEKYIVEVTPVVMPSDVKRLEEAISASTTIDVQELGQLFIPCSNQKKYSVNNYTTLFCNI